MSDTSERRRQHRSRLTRARLIDTGIALFAESEVDEVTVDDICKAAGVAKGTFYFHFETKDALLVAAFHRDGESMPDEAEHLLGKGLAFEEAVLALGDGIARATGMLPKQLVRQATLAALAAIDPQTTPAGAQGRRAAIELLVEAGREEGHVSGEFRTSEIVMTLNWAMLQAILVWSNRAGERPPLVTIMRRRLRLAIHGVTPAA